MNPTIALELLKELRRRSLRLVFPQLFLLAISYFLLSGMHSETRLHLVPYILITGALGVRYCIMQIFDLSSKDKKISAQLSYLFFVFITGLGWGLLLWNVYNFFGLFSIESLFCLGVMLILMASGVTAFSFSLVTANVYLLSITIVPFYLLFTDKTPRSFLLGLLILGNFFYQSYLSYVLNKYHRKSLKNELTALSQKESLQEFIDALPGLVVLVDENQTYVMVNSFKNNFFKDKFLGQKIGAIFPESEFPQAILSFINSPEAETIKEIKSDVFEGENWWMLHLKKISRPEKGVIVAILPITEMVKTRNDLKIQEARSQYAAKLASLGELSAGIAHEVNNPLTIIEGSANLMKMILADRPIDVKTLDKAASKVMETTQRIARIIKSLRMLSGNAEEEPFKNITFSEIVEPSIEISKSKLQEHNINLTVHFSNNVALFGNEIQLSQVIMNLVSNAIDAVKEIDGPRWIEIHYKPSIEWLDIYVIDSGKGVDPEIRQKIMEPFFSTKDSQGTGLGLSISQNIVENHNGSMKLVENTENTTFLLRFPRMNPILTAKRNNF